MKCVRQVFRKTCSKTPKQADSLTVWEAVCGQIHRQAGRPAGWQTRIKADRMTCRPIGSLVSRPFSR